MTALLKFCACPFLPPLGEVLILLEVYQIADTWSKELPRLALCMLGDEVHRLKPGMVVQSEL